jgi:hypothetical protein
MSRLEGMIATMEQRHGTTFALAAARHTANHAVAQRTR